MEVHENLSWMRPSEILFSAEEIPSKFSDHGDLNQVIKRLTLNPKLVNTIPPITVSNRNDGEWHSENNRRLYVFRVLERNGVIEKIQVKLSNRMIFPFVTDDGCHIRMLGLTNTLRHCDCTHYPGN